MPLLVRRKDSRTSQQKGTKVAQPLRLHEAFLDAPWPTLYPTESRRVPVIVSKESKGAVLMKFTAMYTRMMTVPVTKMALGMAIAQYLPVDTRVLLVQTAQGY